MLISSELISDDQYRLVLINVDQQHVEPNCDKFSNSRLACEGAWLAKKTRKALANGQKLSKYGASFLKLLYVCLYVRIYHDTKLPVWCQVRVR